MTSVEGQPCSCCASASADIPADFFWPAGYLAISRSIFFRVSDDSMPLAVGHWPLTNVIAGDAPGVSGIKHPDNLLRRAFAVCVNRIEFEYRVVPVGRPGHRMRACEFARGTLVDLAERFARAADPLDPFLPRYYRREVSRRDIPPRP